MADKTQHPTLAAALCAVMAEVKNVEKTGENTFHRYKYASEADLLRAAQPALARHGVAMFPVAVDHDRQAWEKTRKGASQWLTTLIITYRVAHAHSDQHYDIVAVGSGIDGEDKGAYKAQTGALKYALRQLLLVPTGDDPDAHAGDEDDEPAPEPAPEPQRRPSPPPTKAPHDPSWKRDQARFCAAIKDAGWTYEALATACERMGRPRPSQMHAEQRANALAWALANPPGGAS